MKHYIGKAKFELKNELGKKMLVGPDEFADIPDSFTGDPTYLMAVNAGLIQPFITTKQGDKIEREANEKPGKKPSKGGAKQGGKEAEKEPEQETESGENGEGNKDGAK